MAGNVDKIAAIRSLIVIMKYLGLWPWKYDIGFFGALKRSYRILLHLPLTFTYISLMWLEALISEDFEQAGQVLHVSITEIAFIVKILSIWIMSSSAVQFVHELDKNPIFNLRAQEFKFWSKEQNTFKRIFFSYICGSLCVAVSGYVGVLFQSEFELPFAYYVPFEWHNSKKYWYAYGYNVVAMTLNCASNIILDTIGCYFLFHTSLLYRLIGMRFEKIKHVYEETAIAEMREIFKLYEKLQRLSKQCEKLVSPYILSQIVLSAFIICFSGYRLVQVGFKTNPVQFISTIQFVSVMILQIYLPCYYGNAVTYYANQLSINVYNTNWEDFSPPTRKILNLYMEFLKFPVRIRAGNFFVVGLPIFVKTINNAYSFFAVLLNLAK